jgi:hypothetical protein
MAYRTPVQQTLFPLYERRSRPVQRRDGWPELPPPPPFMPKPRQADQPESDDWAAVPE